LSTEEELGSLKHPVKGQQGDGREREREDRSGWEGGGVIEVQRRLARGSREKEIRGQGE
jgi:hypothetical protein